MHKNVKAALLVAAVAVTGATAANCAPVEPPSCAVSAFHNGCAGKNPPAKAPAPAPASAPAGNEPGNDPQDNCPSGEVYRAFSSNGHPPGCQPA